MRLINFIGKGCSSCIVHKDDCHEEPQQETSARPRLGNRNLSHHVQLGQKSSNLQSFLIVHPKQANGSSPNRCASNDANPFVSEMSKPFVISWMKEAYKLERARLDTGKIGALEQIAFGASERQIS